MQDREGQKEQCRRAGALQFVQESSTFVVLPRSCSQEGVASSSTEGSPELCTQRMEGGLGSQESANPSFTSSEVEMKM